MNSGRVEIGRTIERYVVEGLIGEGGMASVYLVRHRHLGTPAALKVLGSVGPGAEVRLMLEGRVQAALRHPNVVAVTDVLDVDGAPGLLMEYVEPPTLSAWLAQHQPTLEEAESLFRGIVDGVRHAHRYGLVHRDLKPSNVLLARYDGGLIPKVADFGLAKILGDDPAAGQTRSGLTMGTPQYMAPEQFRDAKKVDRRADIFSLGCILYELLAGGPAFAWTDFIQLYGQIMNREYRPLSTDIPQRLRDAVEATLEPERDARCVDCDALLALLDGRGRLANPTVSPDSLPRLVEMPMLRDRLSGATGSLAAQPGYAAKTVVEPMAEPATVVGDGFANPTGTDTAKAVRSKVTSAGTSVENDGMDTTARALQAGRASAPRRTDAKPVRTGEGGPPSVHTLAGVPSIAPTISGREKAAPTMIPEASLAPRTPSLSSQPQSNAGTGPSRVVALVVAALLVGGGGVGGIAWVINQQQAKARTEAALANPAPVESGVATASDPAGVAAPGAIAAPPTDPAQLTTAGAGQDKAALSSETGAPAVVVPAAETKSIGAAKAPVKAPDAKVVVKLPEPVVVAEPAKVEAAPVPVAVPPVETPPAPAEGTVIVEGDATRVVAVSSAGRFPLPGKLAPGTYQVLAWFPDIASAKVGNITIAAGQTVRLGCTAAFIACNPK